MSFGSISNLLSSPAGIAGAGAILSPAILGSTLLGGGTDVFNSYVNYRNYQLQQDMFGYQKGIQQDIFNREDNAIQRRVDDLRAAGLSPVLAAGQGASAGSVVQTKAPQMDHLQIDTPALVMSLLKMQNDFATSQVQRDLMKAQAYNQIRQGEVAGKVARIKNVEADQVEDTGSAGQGVFGKAINDFTGIFNTAVDRMIGNKAMPDHSKKPVKDNTFNKMSNSADSIINKTVNQIKRTNTKPRR